MAKLRPKNWKEFQHYTHRSPPWIKLHKKLLDDFAFHGLPLASRALAPMLWLLASEDKDGWFDDNPEIIAFRIHVSVKDVVTALKPLIIGGFLERMHDASTALADCTQHALTERERETEVDTEKETDSELRPRAMRAEFEEVFWNGYPKKVGKEAAFKAYLKARLLADAPIIGAGLARYGRSRTGQDPQFTAHPATWLNAGRWNDEDAATSSDAPRLRLVSPEIEAQERENLRKMGMI